MKNKNLISGAKWALIAVFSLVVSASAQAKIIYVDGWQTESSQDGKSWATAYKSLEVALVASAEGDEVWCAGGGPSEDGQQIVPIEYKPDATGKSFTWKSGVNVYGGFELGATSKESRNLAVNPSVLKPNEARILFPGVFAQKTYLDGFTLTGCSDATLNGSAVYLRDGANLVNCIIEGNTDGKAGVINLDGKNDALLPTLDKCIIRNNICNQGGGVHFSYRGEVKNCLIYNNNAKGSSGGGISITGSQLPARVINCVIANNKAGNNGGGVWACGGEIINCTIVRNFTSREVGESDSQGNGGGVLLDQSAFTTPATPTKLINSIVWGNSTKKNTDAPETFAGRKDIWHGGGEIDRGAISYSAIENIAKVNSEIQQIADGSNCVDLKSDNTDIQFVAPTATIGLLADYTGIDWNLKEASTVINRGLNSANTELKDVVGNDRIQNSRIDMGAYETPFATSINNALTEAPVYAVFVNDMLILNVERADVKIYSVGGSIAKAATQTSLVNTSDLSAGVYVVEITFDGNKYTQKISK